MRESKNHNIDGYTYAVQQLGAKKGRLVLARVIRIVSGAAESDDPVAKLGASLSDAEVDYLCDTFAATTQVSKEGDPNKAWVLADVFDDHFAGRYGAMVKWLWAALETNYSSFLSDVGLSPEALKSAMTNAKNSILQSPTPPSGGSSLLESGV
jgi:microcystin degradation protein MlrC